MRSIDFFAECTPSTPEVHAYLCYYNNYMFVVVITQIDKQTKYL